MIVKELLPIKHMTIIKQGSVEKGGKPRSLYVAPILDYRINIHDIQFLCKLGLF